MSDRENDPGQQAIDPPENTRTEDSMSMDDYTDEQPAQAIDPPENTGN